MNAETRKCQACHQDFQIDPEDFDYYSKINVPPPTWCSECRLKRRLAIFTDRPLYKRTCDLCGKSIVSSQPADRDLTVYCNPCWWGDNWDSGAYAMDYDPARPFLAQLKDLIRKTPQMALESDYPSLINSDYINHCATAKNCYLIYTADECENVLYSEFLLHNKDSMDGSFYGGSELCYGLINSGPCYRTFFSEDCENCQEVYFSKDCVGCNNCFGCIGLRNKSYYFFNQPLDKETYRKKVQEYKLDSHREIDQLKIDALNFWQKYPHKFAHALRNVNVTGDYVYSSKNSKDMFVVHEGAENCRYCQLMTMNGLKDCYDYTLWGNNAEQIYECMISGEGASNIKLSAQCWPNVRDIEYSFFAISSSYLFGCANVRNKKYCILNKQYSPEKFQVLRTQIIKDMNENPYIDRVGRVYKYGELFPPEFSLVGYNESYAMDDFPLTKEEALREGWNWYDPQPNPHQPTLTANQIPDRLQDVSDSILQEIIACENCSKPFRIVRAELDLLRQFNLPIPHKCPDCRYRERRSRINPPRLHQRRCTCAGKKSENGIYENTTTHSHGENSCSNEFQTSFAPDRPEIVYCEACYNNEIA